jgi:HEAT repeat protein
MADHKELVTALVDILEDNDTDVRASAAQALAKIGRQSIEPLVAILKDKDKSAGLRANAAYILGQIGPQAREALPPLTKALKEGDKELRKRAAFAIANIVEETGGFNLPPGFGGGGFGGGAGRTTTGKVHDPGVVGPSNAKEEKKKPE